MSLSCRFGQIIPGRSVGAAKTWPVLHFLAADAKTASAQRLAIPKAHTARLPAEMAVLVLVEFIRTPEVKIHQLTKTISLRTGVLIKSEQVQMLFDQHGLKKKL